MAGRSEGAGPWKPVGRGNFGARATLQDLLRGLAMLSICLILFWAVLAQAQQEATRPADIKAPPTPPAAATPPADNALPDADTVRRKRGAPLPASPVIEPKANPEGQADLIDTIKPQKGTNLTAKPEGRRD